MNYGVCPICQRRTAIKPDGHLYPHGPGHSCRGATDYTFNTPERSKALITELQRLWRIGDALAASGLTGIDYPSPAIPDGLDVDTELSYLVHDARIFIADVARRMGAESKQAA